MATVFWRLLIAVPLLIHGVTPPLGTPQQETRVASATPIKWKRVTNNNGWSVEYPENWEAYTMSYLDEPTIETGDNQVFDGPKGCEKANLTCGSTQISLWTGLGQLDLKNWEHQYESADNYKILSSHELTIDGKPAREIVVSLKNEAGYPNGKVERFLAINFGSKSVTVTLTEQFAKQADRENPVLPDRWEHTPIFDHMLNSMKFN